MRILHYRCITVFYFKRREPRGAEEKQAQLILLNNPREAALANSIVLNIAGNFFPTARALVDYFEVSSDNETVSRQILWAGNIAKSITSEVTVHCYSLTDDRRYRRFNEFPASKFPTSHLKTGPWGNS